MAHTHMSWSWRIFLLLLSVSLPKIFGTGDILNYIVLLKTEGYTERSDKIKKDIGPKSFFKLVAREQHSRLLKKVNGLKIHEYTELANGFSARLSRAQVQILRDDPQVQLVVEDSSRELLTTHSYNFLGLNKSTNGIWTKTTGSNVIVGVVDSGVWPESATFNDTGYGPVPSRFKGVCEEGRDVKHNFTCNRKLIGARFMGDGFASQNGVDLRTMTIKCGDFYSPRDKDGHGTRVASIAAGAALESLLLQKQNFGSPRGLAYSARIASYKVAWCYGAVTASDIITAMEAAVADGVDVLSVSIGATPDKPGYATIDPVQYFALLATLRGIPVVFAGGNAGPQWFTVADAAPWVLTVGASTMDRVFPMAVVLGNNSRIQGAGVGNRGTPGFSNGTLYPFISAHTANKENSSPLDAEVCVYKSLSKTKAKGKIVLCKDGGVSISEKVWAVQAAEGAGVIVYNTEARGDILQPLVNSFPLASVSHSSGIFLKRYIARTSNPRAYLTNSTFASGPSNVEAPQIPFFSSAGPSPASPNILKPDIVAPGVHILSATPGSKSWGISSGTSLAAAHASGVVALLKALHPSWPPSYVFSAIKTTAYQVTNRNKPIFQTGGATATPFSKGSGHINPNSAADPGLVYPISTSGYNKFLCSPDSGLGSPYSSVDWSFFCPSYPSTKAVDLNFPSISFYQAKAENTSSTTRMLRNVGPAGTYTVAVVQPAGTSLKVSPTKLVFAKDQVLYYSVSLLPSQPTTKVEGAFLTSSSNYGNAAWSFGHIEWSDNKGHKVRIPVVVNAV